MPPVDYSSQLIDCHDCAILCLVTILPLIKFNRTDIVLTILMRVNIKKHDKIQVTLFNGFLFKEVSSSLKLFFNIIKISLSILEFSCFFTLLLLLTLLHSFDIFTLFFISISLICRGIRNSA